MKRIIGKLTAFLLCIVLLLGCAIHTGAIMPLPLKVGDVDRDNAVTSIDATLIQRFLAKISEPSELQEALSDADGDKKLTVVDATAVQRHLANLPSAFTGAMITDYVCGFTSFHSDCEISIADHYSTADVCYIGVPVTFYPKAYGGARRYTLSVDGKQVKEISAKGYDVESGMQYTFFEEGEYVVSCDAECCYGQHTQSSRRVRVTNFPEDGNPLITGAAFYDEDYRSSGDSVLTVTAIGGTAPYQYNYTLYYDGLSPLCLSQDNDLEMLALQSSSEYTTGYINENQINLYEMFSKYISKPEESGHSDVMRVRVTVRDAMGKESLPVTASYIGYEICY